MFRKIKTHIGYKKAGVIIRPASLDEEYEVGKWGSNYPWIRVCYEYAGYQRKYSDITYVMTLNKEIIGYFMAHTEINMGGDRNLPPYGSKLILHDFAVDTKAYAKYSKILIDYMIGYAKYNGYNAITFNKAEEYAPFGRFISRHYDVNEADNAFYLTIKDPRIPACQRHLTVYERDKVRLEDLYFLYDLKFDVLKTVCKLKLVDNGTLLIDRATGRITFPGNVTLVKDPLSLNDNTKALIYLVVSMYGMDEIKPIRIDYDITAPDYYEADVDGLLYVSKSLNEIQRDPEYRDTLIEKGYDRIVPNHLKYDMNERSFSDSKVVYKLVKPSARRQ